MGKIITRLYNKKIDGTGLAIFRIAFTIVMLLDVLQVFYFRHLISDPIPYIETSDIAMWPIFVFWIVALLAIIFGFYTRIATIVNYVLTVVVFGTISSFEYHMFYAYLTISFLYMFLPISQTLSIDRLRQKLKYSNTRFHYTPSKEVSVLAYFIPLLFSLALVYFDSVFYKYGSHLWLHGLGVWLPSSMPEAIFINISFFLNFKYLMIGLSFLTLAFETVFLFTFYRKKWRVPLLIIGVGLHVGILVCFPIPLFALGVIAVYMLMVPIHWWKKLFERKNETKVKMKFYYDGECPLCNRTKIILDHFNSKNKIQFLTVQGHAAKEPSLEGIAMDELLNDIHSVDKKGKLYKGVDTYIRIFKTTWYFYPLALIIRCPGVYHLAKRVYKYVAENRYTERCTEDNCGYTPPQLPSQNADMKIFTNFTLRDLKIKGLTWGIGFIILCQIAITFNSLVMNDLKKDLGLQNTKAIKIANTFSNGVNYVMRTFIGETHHALFMDKHFDGYNHNIAIVYRSPANKDVWLPITTEKGTPGKWISGCIWANWMFRVNGPNIHRKELLKGLKKYTAFWAYKNNISLKNAQFEIKVKKNRGTKQWEKDFLKKQLKHPWLDAGEVVWENNNFIPNVKIIEDM